MAPATKKKASVPWYCGPYQYLQTEHKQFAAMVARTCVSTRVGRELGVTMLIPETPSKLPIDGILTSDDEDATSPIKLLVIPGVFSPDKMNGVLATSSRGALNGISVELKAGKPMLLLDNGKTAELKPCVCRSKPGTSPFAAYTYKGADFPKAVESKEALKIPTPVKGGCHRTYGDLEKLLKCVVDDYVVCGFPKKAIMHLVSLVEWLKHGGHDGLVKAVKEQCDSNPLSSWYVVFQPYKKNNRLISTSMLSSWCANTDCSPISTTPFAEFVNWGTDNGETLNKFRKNEVVNGELDYQTISATLIKTGKVNNKQVICDSRLSSYGSNPGLIIEEGFARLYIHVFTKNSNGLPAETLQSALITGLSILKNCYSLSGSGIGADTTTYEMLLKTPFALWTNHKSNFIKYKEWVSIINSQNTLVNEHAAEVNAMKWKIANLLKK